MPEIAFYNPKVHLTSSIKTSCDVPAKFACAHSYAKKNAPVKIIKRHGRVALVHFFFARTDVHDVIALEDLSFIARAS